MDAIRAEMLKCSEDDAVKQLHLLFNSTWKVQCVPEDWKKSLVVKVLKKEDLTQCDSYRGISLPSVPSKILCWVLIDRVKSGMDDMIRQEQTGFGSGRGTSEQIFALQNILEKCRLRCTLTSLTFRRLLTTSSDSDFGTSWGSMASLTSLSGLSRHFTIRAQVVLQKAEGILAGLK